MEYNQTAMFAWTIPIWLLKNNNGFWWRQYIKSLQIECSQPTAAEKVFRWNTFLILNPNGFFPLCPLLNCRSGKIVEQIKWISFFFRKTHRNLEIHFYCSRIQLHPVSMAIQWIETKKNKTKTEKRRKNGWKSVNWKNWI